MTTSLLDACRRVDADLRTAGLSGRFALFSLGDRSFVYGEGGGVDAPDGFGDQGYVLTAFGTQLLLDEETDVEVIAVELSSALQDLVIDQLGRGWPEQQTAEGPGRILTPAVVDRRAFWTLQGRPLVVLGELAPAVGSEA